MEYTVVGKSLPKTDGIEKATGKAIYIDDFVLPAMLWGKILRSPYPHARILNIDCSKAKSLPGVKAVITGSDLPKARMGAFILGEPVLAQGVVRHIDEPVAAVAAVDGDAAQEALGLISVEYEELPGFDDDIDGVRDLASLSEPARAYVDFIACKGEQGAKEAGKMRLEGKDYVVHDGDVMHFRFNV